MGGIAIEKVSKALPHRLLDQTVMVAASARDCEYVQGCSHMSVSRMRLISLVYVFINIKLFPVIFSPRIYFKSYMSMCSI